MAERETLAPCAIAPQTSLKPAGDITVSSFMPAIEKRTIADSAEGSAEGGGGGNIGEELDANIGLVGAIAIGVGTMIAAGIFVLSGLAVSNVGTVAIVSFLIPPSSRVSPPRPTASSPRSTPDRAGGICTS
jgi:hypothetical protein